MPEGARLARAGLPRTRRHRALVGVQGRCLRRSALLEALAEVVAEADMPTLRHVVISPSRRLPLSPANPADV